MYEFPTVEQLRERLVPLCESARKPDQMTSLKIGSVAVLLGLDTDKLFRGNDAKREQQAAANAAELESLRAEIEQLQADKAELQRERLATEFPATDVVDDLLASAEAEPVAEDATAMSDAESPIAAGDQQPFEDDAAPATRPAERTKAASEASGTPSSDAESPIAAGDQQIDDLDD